MINENHDPCYDQALVTRLRTLHDSGSGWRKRRGVKYVLIEDRCTTEYSDCFGFELVDESELMGGYDCDGDSKKDPAEETDTENASAKVAEKAPDKDEVTSHDPAILREVDGQFGSWKEIRRIDMYDTVELANDAAMTMFESEYRENLVFQQSSDEESTPDFHLGLHKILQEGNEEDLYLYPEAGATWSVDSFGCLKLTGYGNQITRFVEVRIGRELEDKEVEDPKPDNMPAEAANAPSVGESTDTNEPAPVNGSSETLRPSRRRLSLQLQAEQWESRDRCPTMKMKGRSPRPASIFRLQVKSKRVAVVNEGENGTIDTGLDEVIDENIRDEMRCVGIRISYAAC